MEPEIWESLLPGWPWGDMGVAVFERGILVRGGQTQAQRARAIAWGREAWALLDAPRGGVPDCAPLEGRPPSIEPHRSGHFCRQDEPERVEQSQRFG